MISRVDLHLHTTASDGRCTAGELVEQMHVAGLSVAAVTDHDTVAAVDEVRGLAASQAIDVISGIEITAVEQGRDVHVLGYFIDTANESLLDFLSRQREHRMARVEAIATRLETLGLPIDIEPLRRQAASGAGHSIGRPQIARALVDAGHVADTQEAFDRWLGRDCPAFVPRTGPPSETVIALIHRAGGAASLAHPGQTAIDSRIASLRDAGLDALEAYHPDHSPEDSDRYLQLARRLDLLLTGGSDFHGDVTHGMTPGSVVLPWKEWERLRDAKRLDGR